MVPIFFGVKGRRIQRVIHHFVAREGLAPVLKLLLLKLLDETSLHTNLFRDKKLTLIWLIGSYSRQVSMNLGACTIKGYSIPVRGKNFMSFFFMTSSNVNCLGSASLGGEILTVFCRERWLSYWSAKGFSPLTTWIPLAYRAEI